MQIKELPAEQSLNPANGGQLELFFIGVGSAFALRHFQTNFLVSKGDANIMVDFGMSGPQALWQTAKWRPTDFHGAILPTHSHADHVGGIECLGLMNRYVGRKFLNLPKLEMIITPEYQRILWDNTLRGGMECNEEMRDDGNKLSFGDFFKPIRPKWKTHQPREIWELDYRGVHLEIFRTVHYPEQANDWETAFISYGLLIDNRIFVSGDTKFDTDLIELYADRSEAMFHDVQFFPGAVHAPLADLQGLPANIKKKIHLMHYSDDWQNQNIYGFAGWVRQGVRYIFD